MVAGFDFWDAPETKCKSCGYDGGHAHTKTVHDLQMENQELKNRLKFQEGLGTSERENIILFPIVAKAILTVLIVITLGVTSCGIFGKEKPPDPPKPESSEYSETTLEKMKEIYTECLKDPVATPDNCIQAMQVVAKNQQGPAL